MTREERRRKRIEKRNRKVYSKAWFDNDFSLSNGHGIVPYPSFEEWMELGGYVMPSWRHDLERKRRKAGPPIPQGTPVSLTGDLVSDLAAEIAAEEHRQGLPYRQDPSHCRGCADEEQKRLQASCLHEHTTYHSISSLDGRTVIHYAYCAACGLRQPLGDFTMESIRG